MIRLCGTIGLLLITPLIALAENMGGFSGELIFKWMADGRNMTLTVPFAFTAPDGQMWEVPPGSVTDGASIPRVLWSVAGGPFEGKYRDAAVIHDYYCQVKTRPWTTTHLVFYQAMRAAGVDDLTAKIMYGAVYYFGPRWGIGSTSRGPGAEQGLTGEQQQQFVNNLRSWIQTNQPTLPEIASRLDATNGIDIR